MISNFSEPSENASEGDDKYMVFEFRTRGNQVSSASCGKIDGMFDPQIFYKRAHIGHTQT